MKNISLIISILLMLALPLSSAHSSEAGAPPGVKVITAPEVKSLLVDNRALIVHTLSRIEYQMQHIPNTINIPVDEIASSDTMPSDKSRLIVFYCNGEACPYSRRAAETAVSLGYKNIHWFKGGILNWRQYQYPMVVDKELNAIKVKKISPKKLNVMLQHQDMQVVDVRPQWWRESATKSGIIEGTDMLIPLLRLDKAHHNIDKESPVVLVDRQMRQSKHAAKYLISKGYNVAGILKGGSKRWSHEELPILTRDIEPDITRD